MASSFCRRNKTGGYNRVESANLTQEVARQRLHVCKFSQGIFHSPESLIKESERARCIWPAGNLIHPSQRCHTTERRER
jgi:hypothetical protein